jgi:hypothetical protein
MDIVEGKKRTGDAPPLARAALAYARRGMPVFPCEPLGKRPLTRDGFWDASADIGVVERWWSRWPRANVGVPTGERSGLLVLDVDPRDGGLKSLEELEEAFDTLPPTTRARTGSGGEHVFFRYPDGGVRNSASWVGPGLDVRGEGGYVVVPPSRTGGPYRWTERTPLAEAPAWLLGRMRGTTRTSLGEQPLF